MAITIISYLLSITYISENIYIYIYNLQFLRITGTKKGHLLWDNLEGWECTGGGREIQDGGDTCTPVVNSCWRMTEIKPIL